MDELVFVRLRAGGEIYIHTLHLTVIRGEQWGIIRLYEGKSVISPEVAT